MHSNDDPAHNAFVDATLVPMDGERLLGHHTVLVRDGRIARIAPAADARIPPGATRIDGRGKYVMPGLADMHCHYESKDCAALFLANGVTTVRVMWAHRTTSRSATAPRPAIASRPRSSAAARSLMATRRRGTA